MDSQKFEKFLKGKIPLNAFLTSAKPQICKRVRYVPGPAFGNQPKGSNTQQNKDGLLINPLYLALVETDIDYRFLQRR